MGRDRTPQQLAKIISYMLGRKPGEFGLVPDKDGFVKIKEFLKAIGEEEGWRYVRRGNIDEILYSLKDPPIEINDTHIRATQRDRLPEIAPAEDLPKILYIGIRHRAYPNVHQKGIFPAGNPQIILSSDLEMAKRIGRRIDPSPIMLTVRVQDAVAKGIWFWQSGETLFLADFIPADCFTGPPLPKEKPEALPKGAKKAPAASQPTPGAFLLDLDVDKKKKDRSKRKKKKDISRERDRDRQRKRREKMW